MSDLSRALDRIEARNPFPYECEFDFMCGREFATMDERERHEREDHVWEEQANEDV